MPLHDTHLRTPPWRHAFPGPEAREEALASIAAEIGELGYGDEDPGAFSLLTRTRSALAELRGAEAGDDGGHVHAILLFHAYHLLRSGAPHVLASVPVCRWAVEGTGAQPLAAPSGAVHGDAPGFAEATYVQLPQHLFWVREAAGERPRSLDGFFWTVRGDTLHLLGVMAMSHGGVGLDVLPLPGVPLSDRDAWTATEMRETGEDFRSEIPGSELEGLYELRTAGELLKLAARLDGFAIRFPEGAEPVDERPAPPEGEVDVPAVRLVIR